MFRNFRICTAVLMATLSNDVLAVQQDGSFIPSTSDTSDYMQTVPTTNSVLASSAVLSLHELSMSLTQETPSTSYDNGVPSASSPTTYTTFPNEQSPRATGCYMNPSSENKVVPNATTTTPVTTMAATSNEKPELAPTTVGNANIDSATKADHLASNKDAYVVNTQSSTSTSSDSSFLPTSFFVCAALIVAVAVVGVTASRMKKARDADTALVTPDENEMIHIEVRRTPDGGSTIL